MSATTTSPSTAGARATRRASGTGAGRPTPIPFSRLLGVEWGKMFDTRSGFWLLAAVGILSVIATAATILFGHDLSYSDFAGAVGVPVTVILPVLGALSVSSEWGQRTALTTFTLVPGRARVVLAKLCVVVAVGLASMVVALVCGAAGNLLNAAITGHAPVWGFPISVILQIVLATQIGMLMAFMLGALFRNSPAAVVGYFVYALVLPGISNALGNAQPWWRHNGPWFDLSSATSPLYDNPLTAHQWAQLALAVTIWLLAPMAIGVRALLRAEVK